MSQAETHFVQRSKKGWAYFLGAWRMKVCATVGFFLFMFGALFLSVVILPLVHLVPNSASRKDELRFTLVYRCLRLYMNILKRIRFLEKLAVTGLDLTAHQEPRVYVANHPTLIDGIVMMSVIPNCNCVVKEEVFKHPFYGGVVRALGLVPNHGGPELLASLDKEIAKGRSVIVFPEGTRSPEMGLEPFKRGAARIILHTRLSFVPVVIHCIPSILRRGQQWYDVPARPIEFGLNFSAIQDPDRFEDPELPVPCQVRALTRYLEDFFRKAM